MALPAPIPPDLVRCLLVTGSALIQRQPINEPWQNLSRAVDQLPDEVPFREPLQLLMPLISLSEAEIDKDASLAANVLVVAGYLVDPHVSKLEQDMLHQMGARLADLVRVNSSLRSMSGFFYPAKGSRRASLAEDLMERELSQMTLLAVGGAIHDTCNTVVALQHIQVLLKKDRVKGEIALQSGSAARLRDDLKKMTELIEDVLIKGRKVHEQLHRQVSDVSKAEDCLRELMAPEGRVDEICRGLKDLKGMRDSLLPMLHETELGRCLEEKGSVIEMVLALLERITRIDDSSVPVALEDHLKLGLLEAFLGEEGEDIELRMDLKGSPWKVPGPFDRTWQVVINLVKNAREAMKGHEGRLEIVSWKLQLSEVEAARRPHHFVTGTPQAGEYVAFRVRDTGRGISQGALPRIFDLFYSGRQSTGYGLAVTRKVVVEDMGGFLGVDSHTEGPDRGTTFTIYFPRAS